MEKSRNGGWAGVISGQRFNHIARSSCADTLGKHVADAFIQLGLSALVSLKQLPFLVTLSLR